MSTIDELKAKALAIAEIFPGPWRWNEQGWLCGPDPKGDPDFGTIIVDSPEYSSGTASDYLAAVDPGTILALIEDRDEAKKSLAEYRVKLAMAQMDWTSAQRERDDLRREVCATVATMTGGLPFMPRGPRAVAQFRGWTGLYSDDDEPAS